jgi:hypothetical protein
MKPSTYRLIQAILNWQIHYGFTIAEGVPKGAETMPQFVRDHLAENLKEFRAKHGAGYVRGSLFYHWDMIDGEKVRNAH